MTKEKITLMEVKLSRLDDKLEAMLKIIANQSEQLSEINQSLKNSQTEPNQKNNQNVNLTPLPIEAYKGLF